ncbi:hypothetical protein Tsubulata_022639 [Turnera subulata]|uniref:Uncharacterized protein n=1 Tax=Turnera subulata TaxID=218843 RepID=A0A9Q0G5Y3_9ROSI|nr:hypothetical protein Tsubulata_022639 [Turnera subulata]
MFLQEALKMDVKVSPHCRTMEEEEEEEDRCGALLLWQRVGNGSGEATVPEESPVSVREEFYRSELGV